MRELKRRGLAVNTDIFRVEEAEAEIIRVLGGAAMTIFKNITIGQHVPGNSLIHRLDPRTKIIATGLLIVLLFLVEGFF